MSVLIRGTEMPERCGQCFLRVGKCKQRIYMEQRPKNCPLVEIPPHGRLIDANKLMRDIEEYHLSDGKFQHWVDVQQTVIETEGSRI